MKKATIELFERSKGSVVFITTTQRVLDLRSRNVMQIPRGAGTGFIWDADGHVVTNNHVVIGAGGAKVRLNDGRDYDAKLVGASPAHDRCSPSVTRSASTGRSPPAWYRRSTARCRRRTGARSSST
jgi:S1-C subfamily serine protease